MTAEDTDNKWSHVHTLDRHRVQPNLSELNGKMERRRNGEVCEKKKRVSSMKTRSQLFTVTNKMENPTPTDTTRTRTRIRDNTIYVHHKPPSRAEAL